MVAAASRSGGHSTSLWRWNRRPSLTAEAASSSAVSEIHANAAAAAANLESHDVNRTAVPVSLADDVSVRPVHLAAARSAGRAEVLPPLPSGLLLALLLLAVSTLGPALVEIWSRLHRRSGRLRAEGVGGERGEAGGGEAGGGEAGGGEAGGGEAGGGEGANRPAEECSGEEEEEEEWLRAVTASAAKLPTRAVRAAGGHARWEQGWREQQRALALASLGRLCSGAARQRALLCWRSAAAAIAADEALAASEDERAKARERGWEGVGG